MESKPNPTFVGSLGPTTCCEHLLQIAGACQISATTREAAGRPHAVTPKTASTCDTPGLTGIVYSTIGYTWYCTIGCIQYSRCLVKRPSGALRCLWTRGQPTIRGRVSNGGERGRGWMDTDISGLRPNRPSTDRGSERKGQGHLQ